MIPLRNKPKKSIQVWHLKNPVNPNVSEFQTPVFRSRLGCRKVTSKSPEQLLQESMFMGLRAVGV